MTAPQQLIPTVRDVFLARAGRAIPADWVTEELAAVPLCSLPGKLDAALRGQSLSDGYRSLLSSDIGTGLIAGLESVAATAIAQSVEHRSILREFPVTDFKAASVPCLAVGDLVRQPDGSEWSATNISGSTALESVEVQSNALRLLISRQAIVNDSVGALDSLAIGLGAAAVRSELAALASTLEDTATLSDASAFFAAGAGNLLSGYGALTATSLTAAVVALRAQALPSSATASCAAPFALIVPAALELAARIVVQAIRPDYLQVIVLPHLSSATSFYLCADPSVTPCLGLFGLGDFLPLRTFRMEVAPRRATEDGLSLWARNDFRVVRLSRVGICKVTA
jgi:hypothetical protein